MAAGNINERQIDLRSDSTSNFSTLKDYFDSVQILPTQANRNLAVTAGFTTIDVVEVSDAPDGILPLAPGSHASISTTANAGLHGGLVAATKATPLAAAVTVATSGLGHVLNRVEVRDPVTKNPILVPNGADQGALVYGLVHCLDSITAGDALAADASENLSLSLVYTNLSDAVVGISYTGNIEFNFNYAFQRRHQPAVSVGGGASPIQDEIGGVELEEREFEATIAFESAEVLTISTGAGSVAGTSTLTTQPAGEDVALPTDFDTNVNCVAELNGIRLKKGTQVSFLSSDTLTLNLILDIGDVLTLRVPRN